MDCDGFRRGSALLAVYIVAGLNLIGERGDERGQRVLTGETE